MCEFEGRRVVLTGASRGIGRRCLEVLLDAGASVLGVARDASALSLVSQELSPESRGRFFPLAADLTQPGAYEHVAAQVDERWGALDVLVNNAGVMLHHDDEIHAEPPGVLERTFEVNLFAPLRLTRALLPALLSGRAPRVVNVSSDAGTHGKIGEAGIAAYRLSKWSLNGLTMLQAKELEGRVSVLALDPGWVRTDMGGPEAPGDPREAARGLLATLRLDSGVSARLVRAGRVVEW